MTDAVVPVDQHDEFIIDFPNFPDLVQLQVGDIASLDVVYAFRSIDWLKPLVKGFSREAVNYLGILLKSNGEYHVYVAPERPDQSFQSIQDALIYSSQFRPKNLHLDNVQLTSQQFLLLTEGESESVFLDDVTITPTPAFELIVPVLSSRTASYRIQLKNLEIGNEEIIQLTQQKPAAKQFICLHNVKLSVDPNVICDLAKVISKNSLLFVQFAGDTVYNTLAAIKASLEEHVDASDRFSSHIFSDKNELGIIIRRH